MTGADMWCFVGFLLSLSVPDDDRPDTLLVEVLRKNGSAGFRGLFDRYHASLYRFLVRMGVTDSAAEDILQDVFAGLWSARQTLDPQRSVKAYLYRACKNRAANHFRSRSRFVDSPGIDPPSRIPGQDEEVDYALLRAKFDDAVSRLPERRRAVFELCFVAGLSYKEAAEILGISPKTVENHMGCALKAIRGVVSRHAE